MNPFPPDLEERLDAGHAAPGDAELEAQARAHSALAEVFAGTAMPALSAAFDAELQERLRKAAREPRGTIGLSRGGRWIMAVYWLGLGIAAWSLAGGVRAAALLPGDAREWLWVLPLVPLSLLLALDPGAWLRKLRATVAPLLT